MRLMDIANLQQVCFPERMYTEVYRMVVRVQQNAVQGRGLGLVVLDDDDTLIGYGQLTLWTHCGELSDLFIVAHKRGQGIGTAVIQHLTRAARDMHIQCLEIGAVMSNTGALALYRRLGFVDSHVTHFSKPNEEVQFLRLNFIGGDKP